jgi:hypothetical protein
MDASAPKRKQCCACGRIGTRGFVKHWHSGRDQCASLGACEERQYQKRYGRDPGGVA